MMLLIVVENDLYRRLPAAQVDAALWQELKT